MTKILTKSLEEKPKEGELVIHPEAKLILLNPSPTTFGFYEITPEELNTWLKTPINFNEMMLKPEELASRFTSIHSVPETCLHCKDSGYDRIKTPGVAGLFSWLDETVFLGEPNYGITNFRCSYPFFGGGIVFRNIEKRDGRETETFYRIGPCYQDDSHLLPALCRCDYLRGHKINPEKYDFCGLKMPADFMKLPRTALYVGWNR